eukprot:gene4279-14391_t
MATNRAVMGAQGWWQVLVACEEGHRLNAVTTCAALGKLAKLAKPRREDGGEAELGEGLGSLLARSAELSRTGQSQSRQLAGTLWALAKLGDAGVVAQLSCEQEVSAAAAAAEEELSNSLWALAKLGRGGETFEVLCEAAENQLSDPDSAWEWIPQALSNVAWSLGTLRPDGQRARSLVGVLAQVLEGRGAECNGQEVTNTLWAFARLAEHGMGGALAKAAGAVAAAAQGKKGDLMPRHIANAGWACAKLGQGERARALLAGCAAKVVAMNIQEQSMCAWALASIGADKEGAEVCAVFSQLSTLAWAAAKLGLQDAVLMDAIASAANIPLIQKATVRDLSHLQWGMAKLGEFDGAVVRDLSHLLWGMGKLGEFDGMDHASSISMLKPGSATVRDLSHLLWGMGKLGEFDGMDHASSISMLKASLYQQLPLSAPYSSCHHFTSPHQATATVRDLSHLLWGMGKLGEFDGMDHASSISMLKATVCDLFHLLWGMAKLGDYDGVDRAPRTNMLKATVRDLSHLLWGMAKLGEFDGVDRASRTSLLKALVAESAARAELSGLAGERANPRGVLTLRSAVTVLWSLGILEWFGDRHVGQLVGACKRLLQGGCESPTSQDMSNLAWALADAFDKFNSQELLKFLAAFERAGGHHPRLKSLSSAVRTVELKATVPNALDEESAATAGLLKATVPNALDEEGAAARVDNSCGGTGRPNTGVTVWQASYFLAEWLSRLPAGFPGKKEAAGVVGASALRESRPRKGGWSKEGAGWAGRVGVELGAGLGLPSIVAARCLGVHMVATDGDPSTLDLLAQNAESNAPGKKVATDGDPSTRDLLAQNAESNAPGKMVATDGNPSTLDLLAQNAESNAAGKNAESNAPGKVRVYTLEWGTKSPQNFSGLEHHADLVLASDFI